MAAKKLFTADLAANVDTVFGPVPTGKEWSGFSVNFCNRTGASVNVRLAISASATPALSEYYEYDAPVLAAPLERTQLVAPSGYYIIARAGAAGISFNGHGYEE